jgi:hypothetical protein
MRKLLTSVILLAVLFACKPQENKENKEKTSQDSTQKTDAAPKSEEKKGTEEQSAKTPSMGLKIEGSYYCPQTKEMLLAEWGDNKIKKLMYAEAGSNKFVDAQVISESGSPDGMDYKFSFKVGGKTMDVMMGISPGGIGLSTTEKGKDASQRDFMESRSGSGFSIESAKYGVAFFVREIYWRGFKNESNGATLAAEDVQEGTGEGQLYFGYKDAAGKEDFFAAQVDSKTHELTFESKMLGGKVRCQLDNEMRWVMRVFNAQNTKIGDFVEIIATK